MNYIPAYIFTVLVAACAITFTLRRFAPPAVGSISKLHEQGGVFHTPHPMERLDLFALGFICIVYAIVAFIGLGSGKAPQNYYHFEKVEDRVTVCLEEVTEAEEILWYGGVQQGSYLVWLSEDGQNWVEQGTWEQGSNDQFKWHSVEPAAERFRFIQFYLLSGSCYMGEVAVRDINGEIVPFMEENALTDEQDTVPEQISYMNSSYFDEIYHPRTALEYIMELPIYETSHPPLGKGIISLGIRIFGMDPFGWRFMGTLCGVLMLPILYIFLKNLFGRTAVAFCATVVFAFDFMHFTQTRIATIDSYTTFFVMLMFWLMYRWFTKPLDAPHRETAPWLFAAGLAFGLGAASKWSVLYGGAGLAVIWLIRAVMLLRYKGRAALRPLLELVGLSVIFFVLIPGFIYYLSYLPYGKVKDASLFSKEYFDIVWDNQISMYNYHSKLEATHPYQSTWWQWVLDTRPILYYLDYFDDGTKSAFGAFGNPLFWWTGLGCIISLAVTAIRRRDAVAVLILIGWLSELLPWVGITRCAFIYHYFPCTPFMALAVGWHMEMMCRAKEETLRARLGEGRRSRHIHCCDRTIYGFTAICVLMFILFYPVLTGVRVSQSYTNGLLRWFNGQYPF